MQISLNQSSSIWSSTDTITNTSSYPESSQLPILLVYQWGWVSGVVHTRRQKSVGLAWWYKLVKCHMQVHLSGNYIPTVISSPNYTSPPSTMATFLTTHLMVVLQPSGYSVFHSRNTPIQLGLPWWSYPCQCLNTETSTWSNRGFTTETPSISYNICLYIRLIVTL